MIELNLLEKKQPLILPNVLGVDLNDLNFKMLGLSLIIYYLPSVIISQIYEERSIGIQTALSALTAENDKIKEAIAKDGNVKSQVDAYKEQVAKLETRSKQVDEILKTRTNPKKVLEKIARSIPEDLWFNRLSINEKNEIAIDGGSYSPRAVGEFITNINDSPYFGGSVTPSKQENKNETLDGSITNYEQFELKGKIINYDMRTK